jgi:asparagine synthetase B (glutamine-hydrolysing)
MLPFSRTTSMQFHPRLKEQMDVVLTGFLGEFSGSHTWPALLALPRGRRLQETILERMLGSRPRLARGVLRPHVFERGMEALRERYFASYARVENEHPFDVADAWNMLHVQPQLTYQSPAVDRHLFEVRAPHMDADLVDFLLTIPPKVRFEQRIYKQMIAYAFPKVRDVPCTNSGRPIDPHFRREFAKVAARFVGRKLRSAALAAIGRREALGRNIRDLGDDFRTEPQLMRDVLLPLVEQDHLPASLFDPTQVRALGEAHYAARISAEDTLAQLISLGLAFRMIGRGDTSGVPESLMSGGGAR